MKFIFVCGAVMSGVGKGTIASSIGAVLKCHGLDVTMIKIDPYLNQVQNIFLTLLEKRVNVLSRMLVLCRLLNMVNVMYFMMEVSVI